MNWFFAFAAIIARGVHYSLIISSDENDRSYLLHGLLNGMPDLSFEDNLKVFRIVHNFISKVNEFRELYAVHVCVYVCPC